VKLGIDIMGGDFAPRTNVEGAIKAQAELPESARIVLIGDSNKAKEIIAEHQVDESLFDFVHTTQVVEMGEHPTRALKLKPDSSISKGFELLKKGAIDSFGSAGNSGAILVGAMFSIRPILGVYRPCVASIVPKQNGKEAVILDVGIVADCKPDVLYQFAVLGSIYAEFVYGIENPKVGLLNIGEEKEKGNLLTQATYQLMDGTSDFNFVGNVEGRDIYGGGVDADVIVCDGFTGNVVLKQAEAFYKLIATRGLLDDYFRRFNYENYGATPVLGVNGNVLLAHGISSAKAIKSMLLLSKDLVEAQLPQKIQAAFK
jgi:glycerol-3-phosphate acyltransferase PlsX